MLLPNSLLHQFKYISIYKREVGVERDRGRKREREIEKERGKEVTKGSQKEKQKER